MTPINLPPYVRVSDLIGRGPEGQQQPILPGVSKQTICHWIKSGKLPEPIRVGRNIFWRAEDILPAIERLEKQFSLRDIKDPRSYTAEEVRPGCNEALASFEQGAR